MAQTAFMEHKITLVYQSLFPANLENAPLFPCAKITIQILIVVSLGFIVFGLLYAIAKSELKIFRFFSHRTMENLLLFGERDQTLWHYIKSYFSDYPANKMMITSMVFAIVSVIIVAPIQIISAISPQSRG